MPQETKSQGVGGMEGAKEHSSLQGMVATREDERALLDALEKAFDYRGDVTIVRTDGSSMTGYIFDRRRRETLAESTVRLMIDGDDGHHTIRFSEIERLEFSGKDTAHGKTFERWVQRYIEKKLKGEQASIESEPLE